MNEKLPIRDLHHAKDAGSQETRNKNERGVGGYSWSTSRVMHIAKAPFDQGTHAHTRT